MEELDFSKYEIRLQTFNNFPRTTVFIKDLVEAGFAFTGTGSLVFCFACGFTYDEWQDGDDPVALHTKGNRHCPYLQGRRNNGECSQIIPGSFDCKAKYFWDCVNRCLVRQDSFSSLPIRVDRRNSPQAGNSEKHVLSPPQAKTSGGRSPGVQSDRAARFAPFDKKSGYENLPGALEMMTEEKAKEKQCQKSPVSSTEKEISSYFRNCENRLISFKTHFPLLSESQVHALSDAGFYYPGDGDFVQCFSCNLVLPDWQVFKNLIEVHVDKSPACAFVRSLVRRSQRLVSTPSDQKDPSNFIQPACKQEASFSQVSPRHEILPSFNCPGPLPRHSRVTDDKGNEVLPKIIMPTHTQISGYQNRQSPQQCGTSSSPMEYTPSLTSRLSPSRTTDPDRPPFIANLSPQSGGRYSGMDLSQKNRRLQTFATWPQESPMEPFELAVAGFYYTGYKDGVKCYSCNIALKDWRAQDTPWGEHIRWSQDCPLVKNYVEHNPIQSNVETPRPEGFVNNSNREACTGTMSQGAGIPPNQTELLTVEYPRYVQDLSHDRPSSIRNKQSSTNNDHVITQTQSTLWPSLIDGICIKNIEVLQNLCDMGYSCKLIKQVQDEYASEFGSVFGNPDELVEGIISFQQDGHLRTFVNETCKNQESKKASASPVSFEMPENNTGQFVGLPNVVDKPKGLADVDEKVLLQQELERAREAHQCKICMDASISVLFLPCRHLISCEKCASGLKDCPMCRESIENFIRTFLS